MKQLKITEFLIINKKLLKNKNYNNKIINPFYINISIKIKKVKIFLVINKKFQNNNKKFNNKKKKFKVFYIINQTKLVIILVHKITIIKIFNKNKIFKK